LHSQRFALLTFSQKLFSSLNRLHIFHREARQIATIFGVQLETIGRLLMNEIFMLRASIMTSELPLNNERGKFNEPKSTSHRFLLSLALRALDFISRGILSDVHDHRSVRTSLADK
jgi:hypothetical protein